MPKRNCQYVNNSDTYNSAYNQYYFKEKKRVKLKPIRKQVRKNKNRLIFSRVILTVCLAIMLFHVLPTAFSTFILDVFPKQLKYTLKTDYQKLLFPTHNYLYKDLFLGKYVIEDTKYKTPLMFNLTEEYENTTLKRKLLNLAEDYKKINPSIYVWEYGTKSYVNINADEVYPAASIIKIPVLIEMFREIEAGRFTLEDTMVLEDHYRASGSGKLQYSQGGVAHTMDYLAKIMIENSDNSSTNMIISKMGGMPEVNRAMNRWGLKTTHINTWLPDLGGTNVTTAKEMARMFYNIDTTRLLSNSSKKQIANYLSHVKNNRLLQAGLPSDAILLHKTGDIGYMLGDAGIVKTANGKKYIVVILARRPYNSFQGKEFIVEASKIIYNNIANR